MRNIVFFAFSAVVAIAALMALPACSSAAVLFQDNLDTDTIGPAAWPASGDFDPNVPPVGTWKSQESGSEADIQVSSYAGANTNVFGGVQPTAHSGSNYIIGGYHHEYYSNWNHAGLPVANLTRDVAQAIVDCWVWGLAGNSGGDDKMYVAAYAGPDRAGNGAFLLKVNGGNALFYVNSGWTATGLSLVEGVWNHLVVSVDMTTHVIGISLNGSASVGGSFYYQNDATIGSVAFYSDVTAYYDDILVTDLQSTTLTVNVSPAQVDTVTPAAGTHDVPIGASVSLSAPRYINCPNVYVFDHWVGNVVNPNAADTSIQMDSAQTVTAVYVVSNACGDECHQPQLADLNKDCYVNLLDVLQLAGDWLDCTAPNCD